MAQGQKVIPRSSTIYPITQLTGYHTHDTISLLIIHTDNMNEEQMHRNEQAMLDEPTRGLDWSKKNVYEALGKPELEYKSLGVCNWDECRNDAEGRNSDGLEYCYEHLTSD